MIVPQGGLFPAGSVRLAVRPENQEAALQGVDMSSPGVMHARKSQPIERMLFEPLDPQEAQAYPASYEEARRRLVSHLLSISAAPLKESKPVAVPRESVADIPDFEWNRGSLRERAGESAAIKEEPAGGKQKGLREFYYISSFDRLTSKKPKANVQPASISMGVHLRNVLAVTTALSVGALVYASLGPGVPRVSAGVRSFLGDQVAKVKLILPGHDMRNLPEPPPTILPPKAREASSDQTFIRPRNSDSSERLLYSTASIAFTPLK
jgi:hypothetical protein